MTIGGKPFNELEEKERTKRERADIYRIKYHTENDPKKHLKTSYNFIAYGYETDLHLKFDRKIKRFDAILGNKTNVGSMKMKGMEKLESFEPMNLVIPLYGNTVKACVFYQK